MIRNKILDKIRKIEKEEKRPREQWLHSGLCYCCEKYGECDYNPCEAYKKRKEKELRARINFAKEALLKKRQGDI